MKRVLQIVIISSVLFLTLKVNAQSNVQKLLLTSIENNNMLYNDFEDAIIVISILDLEDSKEIERLSKLAEKYVNNKVVFFVITDENNQHVNSYFKLSHFNLNELAKVDNDIIFNKYQTGMFKVFPIHIVLNPEGKITYKRKGTVKNVEKKLEKKIDAILKNCSSFQTNPPSYLYAKNK